MLAFPLAAALAMQTLRMCDRGAPEPLGFHARGFGYVAEVFPPKSRNNAGSRPRAYFYAVGYPGAEWRVDARRLWTAELANQLMPQAAIVSMAGHLVTFDEYHESGAEHTIVLYDVGGCVVRSYTLEQLLGSADLARVPVSDCGRLWRDGTAFYFTAPPDAKLYVVLPLGRVLELTLATGTLRRGTTADFPTLWSITTSSAFANERTEIWPLSLRFSSLTDMTSRK